MSMARALRGIAREISRLSPDWHRPDAYFEGRSEIEHALRRLARQLEELQLMPSKQHRVRPRAKWNM